MRACACTCTCVYNVLNFVSVIEQPGMFKEGMQLKFLKREPTNASQRMLGPNFISLLADRYTAACRAGLQRGATGGAPASCLVAGKYLHKYNLKRCAKGTESHSKDESLPTQGRFCNEKAIELSLYNDGFEREAFVRHLLIQ